MRSRGHSLGLWWQGTPRPWWHQCFNTHSQVKLSVLVSRLDPECVDGIRVNSGCLNLEDVGGHRSVGADAHVLVHHRVRQLSADGVGHGADAAAAKQTRMEPSWLQTNTVFAFCSI